MALLSQSQSVEDTAKSASLSNITDNFGTEIHGADLSTCSDNDATFYGKFIAKRKVLVFRNQSIEAIDFLNFAKHFGNPIIHRLSRFHHHQTPEILVLSNEYDGDEPKGVHGGAADWHTDNSYEQVNFASATFLYCQSVAKVGGDIEIADLVAAYEAWPEDERASLDTLKVIHRFGNRTAATGRLAAPNLEESPPICHHPLVVRHPSTRRKAFYAVGGSSIGIEGYSEQQGVELLDRLLTHSTQPTYCLRHKYESGDLVVFDTLSTLHKGTILDPASGPDDIRLVYRISVM